MADTPVKRKRVRKPRKQKVKQGHKLVWITLAIILIPLVIVGYVLLTSAQGSDQPVEGSRFSANDLNPKIEDSQIADIQGQLMTIPGVETATIDLKSATLRVHLNMQDGASDEELENGANQAWDIVNSILPIETYFTNTTDGKNYDLQIDSYNYLVDDAHPAEGWRFIKITKTGSGERTVDNMTQAKNPDLADQVRNRNVQVPQAAAPEETPAEGEEVPSEPQILYYDEYGNPVYQ